MTSSTTARIPLSPARRPGLTLGREDAGSRWIVSGGSNQVRLSDPAGRLLELLDGQRDVAELAPLLGTSEDVVAHGLLRLRDHGLLAGAGESVHTRGRVRRRGLRAFGLALLDADRLCRRCDRVVRYRPPRAARIAITVTVLVGVVAALARGPFIAEQLTRPVPWPVLVSVFVSAVLLVLVHELAHAASLYRAGGRPGAIGVMLFYGTPAFFCEISDAWRLPARTRARVALAGLRLHAYAVGLLGLAGLAAGDGDVASALALLVVVNGVLLVVNACPLLELDGYVALVGRLDFPNLRAKAARQASEYVGHLLFGAPLTRPTRNTMVAFGLASAMTAAVTVTLTYLWLAPLLRETLGVTGAWLVLLVAMWALVSVVKRIVRHWQAASRASGSIVHRSAGLAALAVCAAALLVTVRVPVGIDAAYSAAAGTGLVVVVPTLERDAFRPGAHVSLEQRGIVGASTTTDGVLCGTAREASVPRALGSPVVLPTTGLQRTARAMPVCQLEQAVPPTGFARLELGETSLAAWLVRTIVRPAAAAF